MQFKVGDKVIYKSDGPDNGCRGVVSHVLGERFEVTWSDGGSYTYTDWPGSCVHLRTEPSREAIKVKMKA